MIRTVLLTLFCAILVCRLTAQISGPTTATLGSSPVYTSGQSGMIHTWMLNDTIPILNATSSPTNVLTSFAGTGSSTIAEDNGNWYLFASALTADGNIYRLKFGNNPESTPVQEIAVTVPGANHLAIDVVFDEKSKEWFGFLVGVKDTLWRLDFGNSLENKPTVSAPMIFPDAIVNPRQITVLNDDGQWYAFVGNYLKVVGRLEFGSDIRSVPKSTTADMPKPTFKVGAVEGTGCYFAMHKEKDVWYMLTTQVEIVYLIEFGKSLSGTPKETLIGSSADYPGKFFRMISTGFVSDCKNLLAYIVCGSGSQGVLRLNFNGSIRNKPTVDVMTGVTAAQLTNAETAVPYVHNNTIGFIVNYWTNSASYPMRRFKILDLPAGSVVNNTTFSPTFSNTGTYTIRLATDMLMPEGIKNTCMDVMVNNPSLAAPGPFIDSSSQVCSGAQNVAYRIPSVVGAASYSWTYTGTGATIVGSGTSVIVNFAANATNGILSVRALDGGGNMGAPRTMNVVVNSLPTATISTPGTNSFCSGSSLVLTAPAGANNTYQWYHQGSPVGTNSNTYAATAAGNYTVTITNSLTKCAASSASTSITMLNKPSAALSPAGNLAFCANNPTSITVSTAAIGSRYLWLGNGTTSDDTLSSYKPTQSGNYRVVVTGNNGCKDTSVMKQVTIHPVPNATITPAGVSEICDGDQLALQGPALVGGKYSWFRNGVVVGGAAAGSYNAGLAGMYQVAVEDQNGCRDTSAEAEIVVLSIPQVNLTPADTAFCEGGFVVLTANTQDTGLAFEWSNSAGVIPAATVDFYQTSTADQYIVTVSRNGLAHCKADDTATVTVHPLPQVSLIWDGTDLTADPGFASYEWFLNGQSIKQGTDNTYQPKFDGDYLVKVTDANGCTAESGTESLEHVSVATTDKSSLVRVYPNPTNATVYIESAELLSATMTDMHGRVVLRAAGMQELSVAHLSPGIYMLSLQDQNGVVIRMEKLSIVRN